MTEEVVELHSLKMTLEYQVKPYQLELYNG